MEDTAPPSSEERLGLLLRGVERMAERFGAIETQLAELTSDDRLQSLSDRVDDYRTRSRGDVARVTDVLSALAQAVDVVLRDQQRVLEAVKQRPAAAGALDAEALDRLTEGLRGLRDDLAESHRSLQEETKAAVERVAGEQAERALRLLEAVGESGERTVAAVEAQPSPAGADTLAEELQQLRTTLDGRHVVVTEVIENLRTDLAAVAERIAMIPTEAPAPPPPADDTAVRAALAELRDEMRRLQGELDAAAGQLRTDLAARLDGGGIEGSAPLPADLKGIYDRLGGIEWRLGERLDPLEHRLAAVEQRLRSLGSDLEHVAQRDDLRRGVDRVLGAVSSTEEAVTGELRAVDARVGALADDVRLVRLLRDQLEALGDGIDGVRQLAARGATSSQMSEVARELGAVLVEIESARSHVFRVEQSSTPVAAEVVSVGTDVDHLGQRIDRLAEVVERVAASGGGKDASAQQVAQRLRQVADSARLRGNGVLDDLRSRRARKR